MTNAPGNALIESVDMACLCIQALDNIASHCSTYEEALEEAVRCKSLIAERVDELGLAA